MPIFIFLGVAVLLALLYVWLKKSPKFDKWCKDLVSDDPVTESPKNKIKDIVSTEKDLGKQVEQNSKEAEKLTKEADGINDFLDKRGVIESKKKEEDS